MAHRLTIRCDDGLMTEIERIAEREELSLNQTVVLLLRRAAGLVRPDESAEKTGHSLDRFSGSWSEAGAGIRGYGP